MSRGSEQVIKIIGIEYNVDVYDYDGEGSGNENKPILPILDYDSPKSNDDGTKPINLDEVREEYPKSLLGVPYSEFPLLQNLTWTHNDVDTVGWEATDGEDPILLYYQIDYDYGDSGAVDEPYEITPDNTTDKYIYWDVNNAPTTFLTTNTYTDIYGDGKWLMGINVGGVWYNPYFYLDIDLLSEELTEELGVVRRAVMKEDWDGDPGAVTCNLRDANGDEVSSGFGYQIEVAFFFSYDEDNRPELTSGMTIPVFLDVNGLWYCVYSFINIDELMPSGGWGGVDKHILFGYGGIPVGAQSSVILTQCDVSGVANGEGNVTVYLQSSKAAYTLVGAVSSSAVIPFYQATGDELYYFIGTPLDIIVDVFFDDQGEEPSYDLKATPKTIWALVTSADGDAITIAGASPCPVCAG